MRRVSDALADYTSSMPETITIAASGGGSFDAYLALPERRPAPAIIAVSSIYGVTKGMVQTLDRYAQRGFIVIAPDVFWRTQPGPLENNRRADAQARLDAYDITAGMNDLRDTHAALAARPEWNGKFAVLGFCFGGQHAFLALARLGADAGVSYHGTSIQNYLDEAPAVTKPFSFHFAAQDDLVTLDDVARIRAALAGKRGEIVVHEGATHGFSRVDSNGYNAAVAQASEERAFALLDELKSPVPA
jgi:carboxymethylenebutenolidase